MLEWNGGRGARRFGSRLLLASIACMGYLSAGCGGSDTPTQMVTGTVTFEGAPVEEGGVTFEDPSTGVAAMCEVGPGGTYTIDLPDGNYDVTIEPPVVEVSAGPDSPPDEDYKDVKNIPEKYWSSATSDLTAQVAGSERVCDLKMTKP